MVYRLNPAWCATARLHSVNPTTVRVGDAAMLLTVLGHLSQRSHDSRNQSAFEENLRQTLEGRGRPDPYDLVLTVPDLRRDLALRTRDHVLEVARRVCDMRNDGRPMVSSMTVQGDDLVFRIAPGPGAVTVHPYFARRVTRLPGRAGDMPYADRSYTLVDPVTLLGFWTVGSVHAYLRLRTWLSSPSRIGLPPAPAYVYDDTGRIVIKARPRDLVECLGTEPARMTRSHLVTVFERLKRDLAYADLEIRYTPSSDSRGHHYSRLSACIASRQPLTPAQEHAMHEDDVAPPPFAARPAAVVAAPAPVVEPEDVAPAAPSTFVPRPGRVRLAIVPRSDAIAPTSSAPVASPPVTSSDDVDHYTRDPEDDVDEPEPDDDPGDGLVLDANDYPVPYLHRPHRLPMYDADRRDQHGFTPDGYGRDGRHWFTGLMADELSAGVKRPGVPVTVTHVGLPPTDRDRWTKSVTHPYCPPPETPHWCPQARLWMSVPHDQNWDLKRFPLHVWRHGNRHDHNVWYIDRPTLQVMHEYKPVATKVPDWDAIFAYEKDLRVWREERPLDLSDLPDDIEIPPDYVLTDLMSRAVRSLS